MAQDLLITADNCEQLCGAGQETFEFDGHVRMLNANSFPFGQAMFATPFDEAFQLIPREQWPDLISQKDRDGSWLDDILADCQLPCKDQNGLGYCHGYGPVTGLEVMRAAAGLPYVDLSAESVAGRVTNWTNNGGDPEEDVRILAEFGACPASFMDRPHSIRPNNWKAGWEKAALDFRAAEFYIGRGNLFDVAATCALCNIATSPWFNWWSHCISGSYRLRYDPKTRRFYRKDRNNWGKSFGDNGFCWFAEGTGRGGGTPSGIVAIRVATPSETATYANAGEV